MRKITYNKFYDEAASAVADAAAGVNEGVAQNTEDLSLLGLPMRAPLAGFQEAKRAYENGTNEVRRLLMDECNLIYECNVCRSMFRCFNNFINHKRSFCRANSTCVPNGGYADYNSVIIMDESLPTKENQASPPTTTVVTANSCNSLQVPVIIESGGGTVRNSQPNTATIGLPMAPDHTTVLQLETVPNTNQAVYQTIKREQTDSMRAEVDELTKMLSNIGTTLGPDGKAIRNAEPSADAPTTEDNIKCDACTSEATFQTEKTLQMHKQKQHASPTSFVFQCPACTQTFQQPSAVMKHLANEHKKPVRRIRMMRDTIMKRRIQLSAAAKQKTKMGARELKRLHAADDSALNVEGADIHVKKIMSSCIYCDKSFERRAALSTHLLKCRAKQEARVGPSVIVQNQKAAAQTEADAEQQQEQTGSALESSPQQQTELVEEAMMVANENQQMNLIENEGPEEPLKPFPDAAHLSSMGSPREEEHSMKSEHIVDAEQEPPATGLIMKRKSPNAALLEKPPNGKTKSKKKKVVQLDESAAAATPTPNASSTPNEAAVVPCRCKICKKQFNALSNLRRHISMFHYRAQRFGCKLCNYRGFRRYDIVNHLGFVHKMTGERETMSVEYVSVHEVEYSKDDVDADILLLQDDGNESTTNSNETPLAEVMPSKAKLKRPNKGAAPSVLPESLAAVGDALDEPKSSTRKSLRRSQSQQEHENGASKRPIRNRVKAVNKDFVYALMRNNKEATGTHEMSQCSATTTTTTTTLSPTTTTNTNTTKTTRTLRRRNTTVINAGERDTDISSSSSSSSTNNSSSPVHRDELSKLHALLTPSKRIASKGAALRIALDLVHHGRAKSSTPPELPAERRQWRPRLSSTSREDMQAGPVIDTTDLEAARRKATPLLDDSFLEKMAKRSTPGAFRLKACLATQPEHSALDTLLQKVDSMQQNSMKRTTPNDEMHAITTTTPTTITPTTITPTTGIPTVSTQPLAAIIKQEPLLSAPKEEIGQFSTYFQTPPTPPSYQTSHYINAHNLPDSPTMATVSDFEDETDDEYEHNNGVIDTLMYPASNGNFYDLQQQQQQQQQQHHQHHVHHQQYHEGVQKAMQPPNTTTLMQHLAAPPAQANNKHPNSLLRSALEH